MWGKKAIWVATVTSLLVAGSVRAAPLNLSLQPPHTTSALLTVNYDAGTDVLTVSGLALTLDFDGIQPPDENIISGSFDISLPVDSAGMITAGVGTLTISGEVVSVGPTLLTGKIVAFGYLGGGGEIFEFLFDVTGGDLAGSFGTRVGVIVDAMGTGFTGSFDSSFSNTGFGVSTTGVPEHANIPAVSKPGLMALTVLLLAAGTIMSGRRPRPLAA